MGRTCLWKSTFAAGGFALGVWFDRLRGGQDQGKGPVWFRSRAEEKGANYSRDPCAATPVKHEPPPSSSSAIINYTPFRRLLRPVFWSGPPKVCYRAKNGAEVQIECRAFSAHS